MNVIIVTYNTQQSSFCCQ